MKICANFFTRTFPRISFYHIRARFTSISEEYFKHLTNISHKKLAFFAHNPLLCSIIVRLRLYLYYRVFDFHIFHHAVYKAVHARRDIQILKREIRQSVLLPIFRYAKIPIALHPALSHNDIARIRKRNTLTSFQVEKLRPRIDIDKIAHPTFDIFNGYVFVILRGIGAHFQPK